MQNPFGKSVNPFSGGLKPMSIGDIVGGRRERVTDQEEYEDAVDDEVDSIEDSDEDDYYGETWEDDYEDED